MKGETIIVDVYNRGKENSPFTGRHGVNMPRYPWTDGPEYITQCPIQPGSKFSQKIILSSEEGTYGGMLTVTGPEPPLATGADPNASDALLINGQPGDLFHAQNQGILHSIFTSSLPYLPAYNDTNASVQVMADLRSLAIGTSLQSDYSISYELPSSGTEVRVLEYNSTVEIVLQGTNLVQGHTTPYISMDTVSMLLDGDLGISMKIRTLYAKSGGSSPSDTISVPTKGWVAIRFEASNPGVWFMHCHVERHLTWGMETAFIVKNGKHPEAQMLPPPSTCHHVEAAKK
ncbi:Laccase-11 [Vitis vinifera]|uniref:Laccase-11 n=1 Tax=Vitis vinifera TaxID=29760 RepID=A0A438ECB4_VITVI|nr:Laccase-11 [Vitis vinifera]